MINIFVMRKSVREQLQVREIAKEVFCKFKRVREMRSDLYGTYHLYVKNGLKYVGKTLPASFQLASTRNPLYPIFRHTASDTATYLFPLHGEPLAGLLAKGQQEGEIHRWLDKCGSIQQCLFEVLRKLLTVADVQGQEEVVLECLRVHNGELEYCYDNWMRPAHAIVLDSPNEFENYYFSQEDLDSIKQLALRREKEAQVARPSKMSVIFRTFLLVLHLGTYNLKERNYEFSGYRLHQEHLKLRLQYFCSRYNQKGLGDLIRKVITGESIEMEEIWKVCLPQIATAKTKKVLTLSNTNVRTGKRKNNTEMSEQSETPIKHSHINRLNCSMFSHSSNKSKEEDSNLSFSLHKSNLVNEENHPRRRSLLSKENCDAKGKKNIKLTRNASKDSYDCKQYHLFSNNKERLNLKAILTEATEIPKTSIKILKYLGLEQYLPHNLYEEKIMEVLANMHIKNNWRRQVYENGSIYLGEMAAGKKEGKGLYLFNSSDFYFGEWAGNCMEGYGTYIFTSGEVYQGELKRGFKEGHGRCIYPDGKSFEGFWSKNGKIGLGKVKFPNEVIFIGLFKPDCAETEGVFLGPIDDHQKPLWENKGILEHYHWQKNTLVEGQARKEEAVDRKSKLKHCRTQYYSQFVDEAGNAYEGEMVEGKKEGFGIEQTKTYIYEGEWSEDRKFGQGTMQVKNLFTLSGQWKDNMLVKYHYNEDEDLL